MPRITLTTGVVVEGEGKALYDTLRALGVHLLDDGRHYVSESKGIIVIKDMPTPHLRNAIFKQYREWLESVATSKDSDAVVLHHLEAGPQHKTMLGLVEEFTKRVRGS